MGIGILKNVIIAIAIYIIALITKKIIGVLIYTFMMLEAQDIDSLRKSPYKVTKGFGIFFHSSKPIMMWFGLLGVIAVTLFFMWGIIYSIMVNRNIELDNVISLGQHIGTIWFLAQSFITGEPTRKVRRDIVLVNKYIRIVAEIIFRKRKNKWKTIIKRTALKRAADALMISAFIYIIMNLIIIG